MSKADIGHVGPVVAEVRPGTQVLYRWAQWQQQHAYPRARAVGTFRKGDCRLLVYHYGRALCVVIKVADYAPKVRGFREWREPFATIKSKLLDRGWRYIEQREEVSHVAH